MDSDELRQMSIDNAKLALNQAKGFKIKTNSSGNFVVSDEHKEGLLKMMDFFKSDKWRDWMFSIHIGMFKDGTEQWINLDGVGNHPNAWFSASVQYHNAKNGGGSGSAAAAGSNLLMAKKEEVVEGAL